MNNNNTNTYTARFKCSNCMNDQAEVAIPKGTTILRFSRTGAWPICGVVGTLRIPLNASEL